MLCRNDDLLCVIRACFIMPRPFWWMSQLHIRWNKSLGKRQKIGHFDCQTRLLLHWNKETYLDRKTIRLHSGVNQEKERLWQQSFVLGVLQELQVVLVDVQSGLVQNWASLVKAHQAFLGVHFAMEFQHALSEFRVRHDCSVRAEWKRTWKTSLDVDFATIYAAE